MLSFAPPVASGRLELRPFQDDDVDDVQLFQSDPRVLSFIPWVVRRRQETQHWLAKVSGSVVAQEGDHGTWAIERLVDRRVIGAVNLSWTSSAHGQAEFGFVLATDTKGCGYAGEATTLLLDAAFPALSLHRAYARVDARNEPSLRMLRRLGLRQEAHLVGRELFKGEWTDIVIFAVLSQEWESLRVQPATGRQVTGRPSAGSVPRRSADPIATADQKAIAALLRTFFGAFTAGADSAVRLAELRAVFLTQAVIVRTCGDEPTVDGVESFIALRQALLSSGRLVDFSEWELRGETHIFGDIAQHFCSYAKAGVQDEMPFTARGMKTLHFVRTTEGWRISAAAWDDERDGVMIEAREAPRPEDA